MGKIVAIDSSGLFFPTVFSWERQTLEKIQSKSDNFIMPPHAVYFSSLLSCLKKIGVDKNTKIVVSLEGKSWRKQIAGYYKAQRADDREKHKLIDWDKQFKKLNEVNNKLDKATDWHFIREWNSECDDILAVCCRYFKDDEVVIVTGDKDLHQLAYYCVTSDTEILTLHGWKKYNELKKQQHVATYNMNKDIIEYQALQGINIQHFDGELKSIKNKSVDILMTDNHKNIVLKRIMKNGKNLYKVIEIEAKKIQKCFKLLLNAKFKYQTKYILGEHWAELIGWFIAEGHFINNNQKVIAISQSYKKNRKKCLRIKNLLDKAKINYKIYKNKKDSWMFYISKCPFNDWIYSNIRNKELNESLISLPKNELQSLFNGLMLGDGSYRNNKPNYFSQKNYNTVKWFEILALKLGYHTTTSLSKKQDLYYVYLCKKNNTGLHNAHINTVKYNGIVWCPTTKNGTWIAKRNGKVFITGNSNVKIFNINKKCNGSKGMYEKIDNPLKIIADKVRLGDVSDNIIVDKAHDTKQDEELRYEIINLLKLPDYIEDSIVNLLKNLPEKSLNLDELPNFRNAKEKFLKIYDTDKVITYDYCIQLLEKRENKKKKIAKEKRDAKRLETAKEKFKDRTFESLTKTEKNKLIKDNFLKIIFPEEANLLFEKQPQEESKDE